MATRPNGEIIHFSDGMLSVMCGKLLLQAKAHICECTDSSCRLEGIITNGPLRVYGRGIAVVSHDQEAVISVQRQRK